MDMKDKELEDFFSAEPINEVEEAPEIETETSEAEVEQTEGDEVAKEEAPVEEAKSEDAEPAKTDPMVPLAALTAERQKAKDSRSELDQLRAEIAQLKASMGAPAPVQPQAQQQPIVGQNGVPDPFDNPQGYHQYVMEHAARKAQEMFVTRQVEHSRARALEKHGADVVNDAANWFADQVRENPSLEARALQQPDIAEWVIAQKKRSDELKTFESDPDAYVRLRAAELGLTAMAATAVEVTPPAAKDTGPKSLVSAKSAQTSTDSARNAGDAFDVMFGTK